MNEDGMSEWVNRAKQVEARGESPASGVKVIRKEAPQQSIGQMIMKVADVIRPHIAAMCEGVRNNEGMLLQPAHIRGIALEVAEGLVKDERMKVAS